MNLEFLALGKSGGNLRSSQTEYLSDRVCVIFPLTPSHFRSIGLGFVLAYLALSWLLGARILRWRSTIYQHVN